MSTPAELSPALSDLRGIKDAYFTWLAATGTSPYMMECLDFDFAVFSDFFIGRRELRVADIEPEALIEYRVWLTQRVHPRPHFVALSAERRQDNMVAIRNFFRWLAARMHIIADPTEGIEFPDKPAVISRLILTQAEAAHFLESIDLKGPIGYRDRAMFEVLYSTGMRLPELFDLKTTDAKLDARVLVVRREMRQESLPLSPSATGYLREYMEKIRPLFAWALGEMDEGFLFLKQTGTVVNTDAIHHGIRRAQKTAKIPGYVTAGTLRRSLATHLLDGGMPLREIQKIIGRTLPRTTSNCNARASLAVLQEQYARCHPHGQES